MSNTGLNDLALSRAFGGVSIWYCCRGSKRVIFTIMDADSFLFSMIFGVIGMAYFVYGKKNQRPFPLLFGAALCVFPYFVSQLWTMIAVGTGLTLAPWFLRSDT